MDGVGGDFGGSEDPERGSNIIPVGNTDTQQAGSSGNGSRGRGNKDSDGGHDGGCVIEGDYNVVSERVVEEDNGESSSEEDRAERRTFWSRLFNRFGRGRRGRRERGRGADSPGNGDDIPSGSFAGGGADVPSDSSGSAAEENAEENDANDRQSQPSTSEQPFIRTAGCSKNEETGEEEQEPPSPTGSTNEGWQNPHSQDEDDEDPEATGQARQESVFDVPLPFDERGALGDLMRFFSVHPQTLDITEGSERTLNRIDGVLFVRETEERRTFFRNNIRNIRLHRTDASEAYSFSAKNGRDFKGEYVGTAEFNVEQAVAMVDMFSMNPAVPDQSVILGGTAEQKFMMLLVCQMRGIEVEGSDAIINAVDDDFRAAAVARLDALENGGQAPSRDAEEGGTTQNQPASSSEQQQPSNGTGGVETDVPCGTDFGDASVNGNSGTTRDNAEQHRHNGQYGQNRRPPYSPPPPHSGGDTHPPSM